MTRRRALKKREQGYGPLDFAPGLSVPGIELSEPNLAPGPSPSTTRHPRQLAADAVLTQAGVDGLRCGKTACRRFVRFAAHYGLIPQDNGKVLRRRGTQMNTMQYDTSFVRVVSASLLGILIAFGLNGAVLAAGTCIEGPNLNSGQSRHWYYRLDRINHRKCWYATETGPKTHEDPPLEPTLSPTSPPNATLFFWFTPLGGGPPSSARAGMQLNTTKDMASVASRETIKVVHALPNERSPRARSASAGMQPSTTKEYRVPPRRTMKVLHAVPNERSRPAPPREIKSGDTPERNQQSPSRSSEEHAEQVNSQPLDQAAQDALFLEFLRWNELQKTSSGRMP